MTEPLSPEREQEIRARVGAATDGPWKAEAELGSHIVYVSPKGSPYFIVLWNAEWATEADAEFIAHAREDVDALLAEVDRLRDELAEVKAGRNPRLRCLIVKADKDQDLYVGWSTICDAPAGVWSREAALEYGFPRSRLDRADQNGSSAIGYTSGHWDDDGFVAEQRGWLRRDRIGDYAQLYLSGNESAAFDLLEPFGGETEARR